LVLPTERQKNGKKMLEPMRTLSLRVGFDSEMKAHCRPAVSVSFESVFSVSQRVEA
jgi:hypothetical protein